MDAESDLRALAAFFSAHLSSRAGDFGDALRLFLTDRFEEADRVSIAFNGSHGIAPSRSNREGMTLEQSYRSTPDGLVKVAVICDHVSRPPLLPLTTRRSVPDFSNYHEPMVLLIELDGSYLGRVILWREKHKPPFSNAMTQRARALRPALAFLLHHLVHLWREQNPQHSQAVCTIAGLRERLSLSTREHQVLTLRLLGVGNLQIAETLSIAPMTVRKHLKSLHRKAGTKRLSSLLSLSGI